MSFREKSVWLRAVTVTKTQVRHELLTSHVVRVFHREKGKAGRDPFTIILNREGVAVAQATVGLPPQPHGKNTTTTANRQQHKQQTVSKT